MQPSRRRRIGVVQGSRLATAAWTNIRIRIGVDYPMGVEIHVSYSGELHCQAMHGPSGATLQTDAPLDNGGRGASFSPTDLVATALGTCVLTILGLIAERHGLDLRGTTVHVTKEMVTQPIRRIGSLRTVVTIPKGAVEDPAMRQRMEAGARQCPVHQSLSHEIEAPIDFVYATT